jgi:DNA-binding CsgD family transcriptional regulator
MEVVRRLDTQNCRYCDFFWNIRGRTAVIINRRLGSEKESVQIIVTRLKHRQIRNFSKALLELYSPSTVAEFPMRLFHVLRRFFSCDFCCYAEYAGPLNRRRVTDPMTPEPTKFDVFDTYLHQLPTRAAALNLRTQSALKLSDFASLREWHRTDLYNHIFRPNKLSYQLSFYSVHDSPQLGVSLNRSSRDFSEDERTILDLLRPHVVNAYRTDQYAGYVAQRPEMAGHAMLLADNSGRILFATPLAERWLGEYFGDFKRGFLPESIRIWLRKRSCQFSHLDEIGNPLTPLSYNRNGSELRVRTDSGVPAFEYRLWLSVRKTDLSPASLQSLGLTPREAEVLLWVTQGKSNGDIATILGMRERTTCKHLERVFSKLSVENRTAAASIGLAHLSRASLS